MSDEFNILDLGEAKHCLGIRIIRDKNFITLDQENYIEQILRKVNMTDCKSVSTPMESNICFDEIKNEPDENLPYQKLIGSLMYLAILTRPDTAYKLLKSI